ncbi:MAG TPA: hypothetical protein VGI71_16125 [Scandinavium sp.]|jgi:hypothetical protein
MKIEDLVDFFASYGVGEYHVSALDDGQFIVRPLTERQIIVDPEVIMEMIAARDEKRDELDL